MTSYIQQQCRLLPIFPFLELSQPQLSKSPRLQFRVRVYMTPAALIACTKEVSLVATGTDWKFRVNIHSVLAHFYAVAFNYALRINQFQTYIDIERFNLIVSLNSKIGWYIPLRSPFWVDSWSALSGQFHLSKANWCLHSWIPLCAPTCTLLA